MSLKVGINNLTQLCSHPFSGSFPPILVQKTERKREKKKKIIQVFNFTQSELLSEFDMYLSPDSSQA